MIVVQHQQQTFASRLVNQGIDDRGGKTLEAGRGGWSEQRAHLCLDPGPRSPYRSDEVTPEADRVVVAPVQRQPGGGMPTAHRPVGQEDRLSVTGRRHYCDYAAAPILPQGVRSAVVERPGPTASSAPPSSWPGGPPVRDWPAPGGPRRLPHPSVTCTLAPPSRSSGTFAASTLSLFWVIPAEVGPAPSPSTGTSRLETVDAPSPRKMETFWAIGAHAHLGPPTAGEDSPGGPTFK